MIRSPRRHEGPPKRPEQTTISTTGLAFGAAREGLAVRHNTSLDKPRANVNSQGSVFSRKTHDISNYWTTTASFPRVPHSCCFFLWQELDTLSYPRIWCSNGAPKRGSTDCGILTTTLLRQEQHHASPWDSGHKGWADSSEQAKMNFTRTSITCRSPHIPILVHL